MFARYCTEELSYLWDENDKDYSLDSSRRSWIWIRNDNYYYLYVALNITWNFILLIQPINNSNKCCTLYFVFSDMNYEEVGITMKYIWYYEKMIWSTVFMFVISNTSTKDNSQNIVHYEKLLESALTYSYFSSLKTEKLKKPSIQVFRPIFLFC